MVDKILIEICSRWITLKLKSDRSFQDVECMAGSKGLTLGKRKGNETKPNKTKLIIISMYLLYQYLVKSLDSDTLWFQI